MTALAETNAVPASEPAADDAPGLSKVDRLRIGGYAAPKLRRDKSKRRIAVVDKDGNVVGYRDLADVQKKILERAKIEFDVVDGVRPNTVLCELCNAVVKVPKTGTVPRKCIGGCPTKCSGGCGAMSPRGANDPARVRYRGGTPWICNPCFHANLTPEQRAEAHRKGLTGWTPEMLSEKARKAARKRDPQKFKMSCKNGGLASMANLTPEQRAERIRLAIHARKIQAAAVAANHASRVVAVLAAHPDGLTKFAIQSALSVDARILGKALALLTDGPVTWEQRVIHGRLRDVFRLRNKITPHPAESAETNSPVDHPEVQP